VTECHQSIVAEQSHDGSLSVTNLQIAAFSFPKTFPETSNGFVAPVELSVMLPPLLAAFFLQVAAEVEGAFDVAAGGVELSAAEFLQVGGLGFDE